jgi:hypothetical protein
LSIEREHRLNGNVHTLKPILLEHDLTHALPVRPRVHRRLREQHFSPRRVDAELLRERVIPEVLHVLPVPHDPVLHRLRDLQVVPQRRGLVAHHDVLDDRIPHALLRPQDRTSYHGWKHWIVVLVIGSVFVIYRGGERSPARWLEDYALTVLGKVGACVSDLDELYET